MAEDVIAKARLGDIAGLATSTEDATTPASMTQCHLPTQYSWARRGPFARFADLGLWGISIHDLKRQPGNAQKVALGKNSFATSRYGEGLTDPSQSNSRGRAGGPGAPFRK
jgi:hypothetical protein